MSGVLDLKKVDSYYIVAFGSNMMLLAVFGLWRGLVEGIWG
jgi:hypothetical protein